MICTPRQVKNLRTPMGERSSVAERYNSLIGKPLV